MCNRSHPGHLLTKHKMTRPVYFIYATVLCTHEKAADTSLPRFQGQSVTPCPIGRCGRAVSKSWRVLQLLNSRKDRSHSSSAGMFFSVFSPQILYQLLRSSFLMGAGETQRFSSARRQKAIWDFSRRGNELHMHGTAQQTTCLLLCAIFVSVTVQVTRSITLHQH